MKPNRPQSPKPESSTNASRQHSAAVKKEEENRQKSVGGGQTNQLGITQGQNGEQGNTTQRRNTVPLGRKKS